MADTYVEDAGVGRRELLKKTAIGGGLVVAALAAPGFTGTAEAKGGKSINLHIALTDTFESPADVTGGTGPFYIGGDIFTQGPTPSVGASQAGDPLGTFHCWGFIAAGVGVVNQEFNLDGRGKIIIAGVEGADVRAVTGGTGDFANARGQGVPEVAFFLADPGDRFRIDFSLTGAKGPSIG